MQRLLLFVVAVVVGTCALAEPACAAEARLTRETVRHEIEAWAQDRGSDFRVFWKAGGPFMEAWGGKVKVAFHGRIMADFTFFDDPPETLEAAIDDEFHSGFQFRRIWLSVNGQVSKYVGFMLQLAMESVDLQRTPFLDVWVRLQNLDDCLGCLFPDVRIGHYQEPIGLAWLTSSRVFQLTAWPLPTTTFTPGYNTGVTLHSTGWDGRATVQLGLFGANSSLEGEQLWRDGEAITGRLTWLPWTDCDSECRLLHLGAGASYRMDLDEVRFRSRPDLDYGPFVVDTGIFDASEELLLNAEAAFVWDRFSVQGEGMWVHIDADEGTDPDFWGWYAQASWLVGAKCRKYNRTYGVFAGVTPCANFDCTQGYWGALELAVRYGAVDLDDGDIRGGRCEDLVLGVNWWLNPNSRVMFNYVHADVRRASGGGPSPYGDGAVDAVVVRFQVHW